MSLKHARILVTGAGGFIGSRLVRWLHEVEGAQVVAFIRQIKNASHIARYPCELRVGDVTDLESLRMAARGCTHIVHAAVSFAGTAAQNRRITIKGASNVSRVAQELGVQRTVFLSTVSVYGKLPHGVLLESTSCRPKDAYGRAKLAAECVVNSAIRQGLPALNLRLPVVFGPWSFWSTYAIKRAALGRVLLPDDGRGTCNALYVDDAVLAISRALQAPLRGATHTFLISAARPTSWRRFYEGHGQSLRNKVEVVGVPFRELKWRVLCSPWTTYSQRLWECRSEILLIMRRLRPPGAKHVYRVLGRLVRQSQRSQAGHSLCYGLEAPSRATVPDLLPERLHLDLLAAHCIADITLAREVLGFVPRFDFEEGVTRTTAWAKWAGIA
jgi:nucleoside-diphosphate-sugar epimerase